MRIESINKPELAIMLKLHKGMVTHLEHIASDTSCKACISFARSTNFCTKWKSPVPAENQASGCDEWSWDSIPF